MRYAFYSCNSRIVTAALREPAGPEILTGARSTIDHQPSTRDFGGLN